MGKKSRRDHYFPEHTVSQGQPYWYQNGGHSQSGARAGARILGGPLAPGINGVVHFTEVPGGTWVCANINGLPPYQPAADNRPPIGPHGFHIHESGRCEVGDPTNPFQSTGGHWNPTFQPHGNHAGDFPVLYSYGGRATMCFFTDRFKPQDVIGRSVVIHENPDDYRTQPAGASGKRLACGVIQAAWGEAFS